VECRVDAEACSEGQHETHDSHVVEGRAEVAEPRGQPVPAPEPHEVKGNLWTCDCSVCHTRRIYFRALEEVLDPLCLVGVGGSAKSELCGELCARLAARSRLAAVDWRSVLGKLAAKICDEMPAVVHACRGGGRDGAQRHYGRFVDSLEALFSELLLP
jgi:hypothetical protein